MENTNLADQTKNPYYRYLFIKYGEYGLDYVIATIIKDEYYTYLFKKYNEYDEENIVDLITEEENTIREKYEMACIENKFNQCI